MADEPIVKILLDYSEYEKLLQMETDYNKLEKQYSDKLSSSNKAKSSQEVATIEDVSSEDQTGDGILSAAAKYLPFSKDSLIQDIASLVTSSIKNTIVKDISSAVIQQVSDKVSERIIKHLDQQKGHGDTLISAHPTDTDLHTPSAVYSDNVPPPLDYDVSILKSDENTVFDETKLLKLIHPSNKHLARALLNAFNENTTEITWNSDGIIFIDQISIPNSNIYEIFPILFSKTKINQYKPGYIELVTKIKDLGMSSLIKRKLKGKTIPLKAAGSIGQGSSLWWYIGP